ncbi:expressed protein [Phakopsora pachyrhizi]|uniref:Expressed protein n=1 Tax=Phakopsora pachyrhizi TaxID=170000 RepID=A0AAV0BM02_PHAPC|nr:expressed protein [Phakopsora pachyrhizi]
MVSHQWDLEHFEILYIVLKDETNHTVDDLQNIANLASSGFKTVEIATPTYYANLVATRAKKWDMSDDNGSTVFTTNSGAQTPVKRQHEFYYFRIGLMKLMRRSS